MTCFFFCMQLILILLQDHTCTCNIYLVNDKGDNQDDLLYMYIHTVHSTNTYTVVCSAILISKLIL